MSAVPLWWVKPRVVSVIVDNDSWVLEYARRLVEVLRDEGDDAALVRRHEDVRDGAIAFYLGCIKVTAPAILARNRRNLVVHASELPKGRGFSPLVWQILEGKSRIPVCLIEAVEEVDAGPIVDRADIVYQGHELNDELRAAMGDTHVILCHRFMKASAPPVGAPQAGEPTRYRRRTPVDSRLDTEKPIATQFDLLRVVDNRRYPAFFDFRGHRYLLKIEKAPEGHGR